MIKTDKKIKSHRSNWQFNKSVTESFDDHVRKSVPFYDVSHSIIEGLSDFFLKDKSVCYDLGCSTGTLLSKLRKRHSSKKISFVGYDQSKHMINKAKKGGYKTLLVNVELELKDAIRRSKGRSRVISEDIIKGIAERLRERHKRKDGLKTGFEILSGMVDMVYVIDDTGEYPVIK